MLAEFFEQLFWIPCIKKPGVPYFQLYATPASYLDWLMDWVKKLKIHSSTCHRPTTYSIKYKLYDLENLYPQVFWCKEFKKVAQKILRAIPHLFIDSINRFWVKIHLARTFRPKIHILQKISLLTCFFDLFIRHLQENTEALARN